MSKGAELIVTERARQVTEEGYDVAHDAGHSGALIDAGTCYAIEAKLSSAGPMTAQDLAVVPPWWPWSSHFWKPTGDPVRDLTKAGALIAAAIDSLLAERETL